MWRIVKAEVFYRIWQPIGIYLLFSPLIMLIYMFFNQKIAFDPSIGGELLANLSLLLIVGVSLPIYIIMLILLNREFRENRIRLMMMLPLSSKLVGTTRLAVTMFLFALALPIWYGFLCGFLISVGLVTDIELPWLMLSLFCICAAWPLYNRIANELQYLSGRRIILSMVIFWSNAVLFGGLVLLHDNTFILPAILRQMMTPLGSVLALALAGCIFIINRNIFPKRVNFADSHKPEPSMSDFLRTFRGEKTYRNQL